MCVCVLERVRTEWVFELEGAFVHGGLALTVSVALLSSDQPQKMKQIRVSDRKRIKKSQKKSPFLCYKLVPRVSLWRIRKEQILGKNEREERSVENLEAEMIILSEEQNNFFGLILIKRELKSHYY